MFSFSHKMPVRYYGNFAYGIYMDAERGTITSRQIEDLKRQGDYGSYYFVAACINYRPAMEKALGRPITDAEIQKELDTLLSLEDRDGIATQYWISCQNKKSDAPEVRKAREYFARKIDRHDDWERFYREMSDAIEESVKHVKSTERQIRGGTMFRFSTITNKIPVRVNPCSEKYDLYKHAANGTITAYEIDELNRGEWGRYYFVAACINHRQTMEKALRRVITDDEIQQSLEILSPNDEDRIGMEHWLKCQNKKSDDPDVIIAKEYFARGASYSRAPIHKEMLESIEQSVKQVTTPSTEKPIQEGTMFRFSAITNTIPVRAPNYAWGIMPTKYDLYERAANGTITASQINLLKESGYGHYYFVVACINFRKTMEKALGRAITDQEIQDSLEVLPPTDQDRIAIEHWLSCQNKTSDAPEIAKARRYFQPMISIPINLLMWDSIEQSLKKAPVKPKDRSVEGIENSNALLQDFPKQLEFIKSKQEVKFTSENQTDPESLRVKGVCYLYNLHGRNLIEFDYANALFCLEKAMAAGDHYAPIYCYFMARDGLGYEEKNPEKASQYLDKVWEKGQQHADIAAFFKEEIRTIKSEDLSYAQALVLASDQQDERYVLRGISALNRLVNRPDPQKNQKAYWDALARLTQYAINNKTKVSELKLEKPQFYCNALLVEENPLPQNFQAHLAEVTDLVSCNKNDPNHFSDKLKNIMAQQEAKRVAEAEAAKKLAAEREAKHIEEAEAAKKLAAEFEAKRVAEAEATKKLAAEQEAKRIAEAEAAKKLAAEEEAKRVAEAEAAKKLAAEQEAKRVAEAAEAKKTAAAEEAKTVAAAKEAKKVAAEQKLNNERQDTLNKIDEAFVAIKPFLFHGTAISNSDFIVHAGRLNDIWINGSANKLSSEQLIKLAEVLTIYRDYVPKYAWNMDTSTIHSWTKYSGNSLNVLSSKTKGVCFKIIAEFWRKGKFHSTKRNKNNVLEAFLALEAMEEFAKDKEQIKAGFDEALQRYLDCRSKHAKERQLLARFIKALRTGEFNEDALFENVSSKRMEPVQIIMARVCGSLQNVYPERCLKLLQLIANHKYQPKRHNFFLKAPTTLVTTELASQLLKVDATVKKQAEDKAKKQAEIKALPATEPKHETAAPPVGTNKPVQQIYETSMYPTDLTMPAVQPAVATGIYYPALPVEASTLPPATVARAEGVPPPAMNPDRMPVSIAEKASIAVMTTSGSPTLFAPAARVASPQPAPAVDPRYIIPGEVIMDPDVEFIIANRRPMTAAEQFLASSVPTQQHAQASAPPAAEQVEGNEEQPGGNPPARRVVVMS